jgi:hypothetical protein
MWRSKNQHILAAWLKNPSDFGQMQVNFLNLVRRVRRDIPKLVIIKWKWLVVIMLD